MLICFFDDDFETEFEQVMDATANGTYEEHPECHSNETALELVHKIEMLGKPVVCFDYPGGYEQYKIDVESGKLLNLL